MAWSLNRVELVGNVGKDPDIRTTQDGLKIVNLSLATSESWTDKNSGERKERTEWHRVVIFNDRLADVVFVRHNRPAREDACAVTAQRLGWWHVGDVRRGRLDVHRSEPARVDVGGHRNRQSSRVHTRCAT